MKDLAHRGAEPTAVPRSAEVARKALLRAADRWGLAHKDLAEVLGVSAASLSRLAAAQREVDLDGKEGELTLFVLRIYRSLDAMVGGDDEKAKLWLTRKNHHLGGVPLTLMTRIDGIVRVADYLDAMRAKV